MVQRCCVPFCDTKVGDADINGVKVRFHRMPMHPERFQQWRSRITNFEQYKPEPDLTPNSRICSKHFLKQDYLDNNCQKPITGNHILTKDALPSRFRWSSENCDVSAAVPFVRRIKSTPAGHHPNNNHHLQNNLSFSRSPSYEDNGTCIEHSDFEKQTQCSFDDERLKNEISRKNSIIQQLLERISQLEAEHKATTQILLKESLTGAATSVIRSTSPNLGKRSELSHHHNVARDRDNHHYHNNPSVITHSNQNFNNNITSSNNNYDGTTTTNSSKKRKLQPQPEEDENIHYVLLSLSEKVVRHDVN